MLFVLFEVGQDGRALQRLWTCGVNRRCQYGDDRTSGIESRQSTQEVQSAGEQEHCWSLSHSSAPSAKATACLHSFVLRQRHHLCII